MTSEERIKRKFPDASCFGPVKLYWPGQGERIRFIVTLAPHLSRSVGEGLTAEDAWKDATTRLEASGLLDKEGE